MVSFVLDDLERRLSLVEADAPSILLGNLLGMGFLYSRGIGV
jgi:hypothetical protein